MNLALCIDPGLTTGWALTNEDGSHLSSGVWDFHTKRLESGGMRYLKFEQRLIHTYDAAPFVTVFFEEVRRHLGTNAAHVYGAMVGVLMAYCERHGISYQSVPVGTLKRFWTGKGNADKAAMIAASKLYGHDPVDDNEADAIALAFWAMSCAAKPNRHVIQDNVPDRGRGWMVGVLR